MNIFTKALNVVGLQSTEGTKVRIQELEKMVEEGQALATSQFADISSLRKELFQERTARGIQVAHFEKEIQEANKIINSIATIIREAGH